MKKLLVALLFIGSSAFGQTIQSPTQFLGYQLGERFSRHHQVVDYFNYVAANATNVKLEQYGETYEHRPLMVAILSSPENMAKIDEIRTNNLKRAQMLAGQPTDDGVAIVWLSYNIHGNEASSTEAAMKTLFALVDPNNKESKEWLKNTVVIIDPCINPDGRDRYANFYNQYGNKDYNPNGDDIEHHEPWPGGRPNHYLFDLNRDWAWQTQTESISRSKIYHQWMPQIHVDFHEQFINNPYYFAPAAEPFHEIITPWQREFQTAIGKNHAKYFDKNGWLYFTKESFDLLYPSYGDTYPTYNGAIGMTYEQAGHGYAGLGVITEYGDTLALTDRIAHHYTTGMSTIEMASKNAAKLDSEFIKYFDDNVKRPTASYKTYVVKNTNADKIKGLTKFLDKQMIKYGAVNSTRNAKGFGYITNSQTSFTITPKDLIINVYQPTSRLITALFEPKTKLSDTLTYDITAWALPYVYGLDAYAMTEKLSTEKAFDFGQKLSTEVKKTYAYISKYNSIEDVKWLAYLLRNGVNVRVAHKELTVEGTKFERGSLIITQRNNENIKGGLDAFMVSATKQFERNPIAVSTGFADSGVDLGSSSVARLAAPKVAVLTGDQTSSLNYGEIWHFFERQIDYPITSIGTDYFSRVKLSDYDVLIVPNGYYSLFNEGVLSKVNDWVRDGGKLIVIGYGLNAFKEQKGYALKEYFDEKEKKDNENKPSVEDILKSYESQERDGLSSSIFGAVFKIRLDNTNPLAYGYNSEYFSLKTSTLRFAFLEEGDNVGVIKGDAKAISGFAGTQATNNLENSLVFGVESKGRGSIVYMVDNPLFRGFWENGKLLFSNAVFMVGK
ncbi:MAG TPA: M14 family metallopeptidase [Fulvivirga sp.]|nr:M14 family metallopeptidase [Fulvivirga sp.]